MFAKKQLVRGSETGHGCGCPKGQKLGVGLVAQGPEIGHWPDYPIWIASLNFLGARNEVRQQLKGKRGGLAEGI
jgi:hypothetical protein